MCRVDVAWEKILGRLRFYHDNGYETFCADVINSCVLPGFLFVNGVVDDKMEAMSRSSLCVQNRNENDSEISRYRSRREILTSQIYIFY